LGLHPSQLFLELGQRVCAIMWVHEFPLRSEVMIGTQ
jgi:hypothetical protein